MVNLINYKFIKANKAFRTILLSLAAILLTACSGNRIDYDNVFEGVETDNYEALTLAHMDDDFATFAELLDYAEMETDLVFAEDYTLFLPVNEAFDELEVGTVEELLNPQNKVELHEFIKRHVLPNKIPVQEFQEMQVIQTADEEEVTVSTGMTEDDVTIGGAAIVKPNIETSDGVIHIVDGVVRKVEDVLP